MTPDGELLDRVEVAGRLVEDQDLRRGQDGARNGEPLLLSARQLDAALADEGVVAVRQSGLNVTRAPAARGRVST
jgi:hypothetical protein